MNMANRQKIILVALLSKRFLQILSALRLIPILSPNYRHVIPMPYGTTESLLEGFSLLGRKTAGQ
jgi:hypothetical protein